MLFQQCQDNLQIHRFKTDIFITNLFAGSMLQDPLPKLYSTTFKSKMPIAAYGEQELSAKTMNGVPDY